VSWLFDRILEAAGLPRASDPDVIDRPPAPVVVDSLLRAQRCIGKGAYYLGTGDYRPVNGKDEPWTTNADGTGCDCSGFALCYCQKLPRHRPGFNRGGSVTDWINCDSAIEDACGVIDDDDGVMVRRPIRELFEPADYPYPGTMLVWAAIRKNGKRIKIGHASVVESCTVPLADWGTRGHVDWRTVTLIQCRGPNGKRPGVVRSIGTSWENHDQDWARGAKPWRGSKLLRRVRR
jgi:hypothetical protein